MNDNDNKMFIPEHCNTSGTEITTGYGKWELLQSIPFIIVCFVISLLLFLFKSHNITTPIFGIAIGCCSGFIFCKKDRFSRESILDNLKSYYKYLKSQNFYDYGGKE